MTAAQILTITFIALEGLTRVLLALRVIMRRAPVTVSLSWLLVLFFLPIISIGLYCLVGEPRLGMRRAGRYEAITRSVAERAVQLWTQQAEDLDAQEAAFRHLASLVTSVSGLPPLKGNSLEVMDKATEVLDRLIVDIDGAKHHCHLLYYIWMPQSGGKRVGQALIRAAKRGVTCRVLVDSVGSRSFLKSDLCREMRSAGVRVVEALPANLLRMVFARVDLRNHRKIAVIDGVTAYCGSQNLTDETFRIRKTRKLGAWIDATVRLEGPAVQALQTVFLRDWASDAEEQLLDLKDVLPPVKAVGTSIVHVIPSGPGDQSDTIHHAFLAMLYAAREEIVITTPYFVPDEATKSALINAALRGVSVILVLPDQLDAVIVAAAARAHYEDLLVAGVRILNHAGGLLHSKTAVIDRELGMVGSANFDMRSFWLNFECTLFIYDDDFAGILRFMQTQYIEDADEIDLTAWRARPMYRRFVDNTAQLLGPLL